MLTCQMVYHHDNCLNTKKPYAKPCRLCIDACPHQAISEYREIDPKKCTECGACMAVCPSDGFVDRSTDLLHNYIEMVEGEQIILNCPQAAPLGFELPCLGIIDHDLWLTLMHAAKDRKITIHTGKCAECPDKRACALSVKTFKEIHEIWPDHSPIVIKVSPDQAGNAEPQGNISKGALLKAKPTEKKGWKEKGWEKLETILPGLTADESYPIPRTRQLLVRRMEATPEEKFPFPVLRISDKCTSCGVCAAICPQRAITKKENGDELTLVYEPFKCVRCKRCVNICSTKAMDFSMKKLGHRHYTGKILLHKGSPKHCIRCGKQVFDNSEPPMCIACASSSSDSIFNSKT